MQIKLKYRNALKQLSKRKNMGPSLFSFCFSTMSVRDTHAQPCHLGAVILEWVLIVIRVAKEYPPTHRK